MQVPDSFEFGISQLHALGIYDRFADFAVGYCSPHFVLHIYTPLDYILYMFSTQIGYIGERICGYKVGETIKTTKMINDNHIILPLFCRKLQMSCYNKHPTVISNVNDVKYPIVANYTTDSIGTMPPSVCELQISQKENGIPLHASHLPPNLEKLVLLELRCPLNETIVHLTKLRHLELTNLDDGLIMDMKFPKSIDKIDYRTDYYNPSVDTLKHLFAECPNLMTLKLSDVTPRILQLFKKYSFCETNKPFVYEKNL